MRMEAVTDKDKIKGEKLVSLTKVWYLGDGHWRQREVNIDPTRIEIIEDHGCDEPSDKGACTITTYSGANLTVKETGKTVTEMRDKVLGLEI